MHPLPSSDLLAAVTNAGPVWQELRGARVLLTGASGFFGRWLVETLACANRAHDVGISVIAVARDAQRLSRLTQLCPGLSLQLLACDVRELPLERSFSHAVHLASPSAHDFNAQNHSAQSASVVEGTRRIAECAARQSARLLLASSGAVYGEQPLTLAELDEDYVASDDAAPAAMGARAHYGAAKRAAEEAALALGERHGSCVTLARCFSFVGPAQPLAPYAIGQFLQAALASQPIVVRGAPDTVRSYLYASDLTAWLLRALTRGAAGRAYNIGSSSAVTMRELAELVAREQGSSAHFDALPDVLPSRYVPSIARAQAELGCTTTVHLASAVQKTATWLTESA